MIQACADQPCCFFSSIIIFEGTARQNLTETNSFAPTFSPIQYMETVSYKFRFPIFAGIFTYLFNTATTTTTAAAATTSTAAAATATKLTEPPAEGPAAVRGAWGWGPPAPHWATAAAVGPVAVRGAWGSGMALGRGGGNNHSLIYIHNINK